MPYRNSPIITPEVNYPSLTKKERRGKETTEIKMVLEINNYIKSIDLVVFIKNVATFVA